MSVTADERYHGLDFLRGIAMSLGVLLHTMMAFVLDPQAAFWPVRVPESERGLWADVGVFAIHDFRMQTFFLLAGFFGCLTYQRGGMSRMLRHRGRRLVIPFILALVFFQPLLQILWMIGTPTSYAMMFGDSSTGPTSGELGERLHHHFLSGVFLRHIHPMHLWFLMYLAYCFVLIAMLIPLGNRLTGTSLGRRVEIIFRWLATRSLGTVVLVLLWAGLLWPMKSLMADTPKGWIPQGYILVYYFAFFVFGWMLFRQRDVLDRFGAGWTRSLVIANVLVCPIAMVLYLRAMQMLTVEETSNTTRFLILKGFVLILLALYSWMMIQGLFGLFMRVFHQSRGWVRYLADASYWIYLFHLFPVIIFPMLLRDVPMPGVLKCLLVVVLSMGVCLLTYQVFVRRTASIR